MEPLKKRGAIVFDVYFVLVIAAVLIMLVLFFMFNSGILDWIGHLPAPEDTSKDKVIDDLPEDTQIQLNYFKVAVIREGKKILFCNDGDCSSPRPSELYFHDWNERSGEVYVTRYGPRKIDNIRPDSKIGSISGSTVDINEDFLERTKSYTQISELPSRIDLYNLDGAIYISGILFKSKKVEEEEIIEKDSKSKLSVEQKFDKFLKTKIFTEDGEYSIEEALVLSADPYFAIVDINGDKDIIALNGVKIMSTGIGRAQYIIDKFGRDGWMQFQEAHFKFQDGGVVKQIARELEKFCQIDRGDRYIFHIPQGVIKDGILKENVAFNPQDQHFYTDPIKKKIKFSEYGDYEFELEFRMYRECAE